MTRKNVFSRTALLVVIAGCIFSGSGAFAQITVFSDNFNRSSLNPAPNGSSYTTTATGDGGASIASNRLVLTNDSSGMANTNGSVSVAINTTSFSAPYSPTLSSDGAVTWTLNMQQIRTDPSGFTGSLYGVAFILAGSAADFTTGNGYALVLGESGSTDPIRLVSYTAGIALSSTIVTGTGPLTAPGADFLSIRVAYSASSNTWSLFGRDDGSGGFADPATGSLVLSGSATDSSFTAVPLNFMGAYWKFSTAANQIALFDNITVAVPEPRTWISAAFLLIGLVICQRRRLSACLETLS